MKTTLRLYPGRAQELIARAVTLRNPHVVPTALRHVLAEPEVGNERAPGVRVRRFDDLGVGIVWTLTSSADAHQVTPAGAFEIGMPQQQAAVRAARQLLKPEQAGRVIEAEPRVAFARGVGGRVEEFEEVLQGVSEIGGDDELTLFAGSRRSLLALSLPDVKLTVVLTYASTRGELTPGSALRASAAAQAEPIRAAIAELEALERDYGVEA